MVRRLTDLPEYGVWQQMIQRCTNPRHVSYPNYGGRGITVCSRWRSFQAFFADMGARPSTKHSLERKDNEKPYQSDNCAWVTKRVQMRNTRSNLRVTFKGLTLTMVEWAERFPELKLNTLYHRWYYGIRPPELFFSAEKMKNLWLAKHRDKKTCRQGHEFTPDNTYTTRNNARCCRTCGRLRAREKRARQRSQQTSHPRPYT